MAMQSLNADPYNCRAEELAVAECARGVEVRRTWSEQEMVRSFGGQMFPGTPDGVFESWEGTLTCVQVVRVPVTAEFTPLQMQEVLAYTILVKVIKSQHWLRACNVVPQDFVIFCWLPFPIPDEVAEGAHALMQRVQQLDPRFSLKLRVPSEPGALFPARFAATGHERRQNRHVCESEVSTYTGIDEESDEDEACVWDITWAWDSDLSFAGESDDSPADRQSTDAQEEGEEASDDDDDYIPEWDITWEWQAESCPATPQQRPQQQPLGFGELDQEAKVSDLLAAGVDEIGGNFVWDNGG